MSSETIHDNNDGEGLSPPLWYLNRWTVQGRQLAHGQVEGGMS